VYVTSAKPLTVQGGVGDAVGEGDAAGDAAGEAAGAGAVCAEVAAKDATTMAASRNATIKTLRKKYLSLLSKKENRAAYDGPARFLHGDEPRGESAIVVPLGLCVRSS
jgi:hypothetical protein